MHTMTYGDERLFLIVADEPADAGIAAAAVADVDGRIAQTIPLAEAAQHLAQQSRIDGLIVELGGCDPDSVAEHLPMVAMLAAERHIGMCVAATADQVDAAWTAVPASAPILVDADITTRVITLATLLRNRGFHDVSRADAERQRLVNQEVTRFAETLMRLTNDVPGETPSLRDAGNRFTPEPVIASGRSTVDAAVVRNLIRARRMRSAHFAPDLFADPAWDMLLDLFASELEHRRVSVSSLCIAAAVPGTTALRWIGTMIDAQLFERQADLHDRRRAYVALTDKARQGMYDYFDAVARAGLAPA